MSQPIEQLPAPVVVENPNPQQPRIQGIDPSLESFQMGAQVSYLAPPKLASSVDRVRESYHRIFRQYADVVSLDLTIINLVL